MAASTGPYTGRRFTWRGRSRKRFGVTQSYRELFDSGVRRAPKRREWVHLRSGDQGTVGELVEVAEINNDREELAIYQVTFDNGIEMTINLPCDVVAIEP